jgi:two-component sensor histidine kinase/CHASE3 domain sensor protein
MARFNTSRFLGTFLTSSATRTLLIWIAIAVLSGLAAIVAWRWTVKAADRVTHTLLIQQELTKWLSAAQDLETGQLGYLLTKNPHNLRPYRSAKVAIAQIHGELTRLVGDNPEQTAVIKAIDTTLQQRLSLVDKSISESGESGTTLAEQRASISLGMQIMGRLRNQIATTSQQEQILFNHRVEQFRNQSFWLLAAMLATLFACAALAMMALIRERQRVAALELTALTLTSTNRSLERRVNVRTEELAIERDRAEAERERAEALLRDVTHRIGNTLALVVGFINLHIRHTSDPKSLKTLTGARDRIHAIASAQRRINVASDLELVRIDTLIQAVLDDVVEAASEDRILLTIDVPPLLASAQVATSLCVLTQEFVVNSFKHAFDEDAAGHVSVRLVRCGESGAELVVEDDGNGVADDLSASDGADPEGSTQSSTNSVSAEGLGTKIAVLLTRQFAGNISYERARPGEARPGTRVVVKLTDLQLTDPEEATSPSTREATASSA